MLIKEAYTGPKNHYDTLTWFQERHYERFWKGVEVIDDPMDHFITQDMLGYRLQPDTDIIQQYFDQGAKPVHLGIGIDNQGRLFERVSKNHKQPMLRFKDGTILPYPIAGGADFPLMPTASWTPFGLQFPYIGAGADSTTSTTPASQFQQYRDLTLNGTMTCNASSPQIILCRKLDMAGNIIDANGLGAAAPAAGGTGAGAAGLGGGNAFLTTTVLTAVIAPSGSVSYDLFQNLFAGCTGVLGGAGSSGTGLGGGGVAGAAAAVANIFAALSLYYLMIGTLGGGSGGNGSGGSTTGTQVLGGVRGSKGAVGSTTGSGGGSGSGVGAGGGGGNGNTTGGTGGTGGAGGGVLIVVCDDIVNTAGTIRANGNIGGNSSGTNAGAGSGGGGGISLCFARHCQTAPTVTANGGATGSKSGTGGVGSAGGAGIAQLVRSL